MNKWAKVVNTQECKSNSAEIAHKFSAIGKKHLGSDRT